MWFPHFLILRLRIFYNFLGQNYKYTFRGGFLGPFPAPYIGMDPKNGLPDPELTTKPPPNFI